MVIFNYFHANYIHPVNHVSDFYLGCKIVANFKIVTRKFGQLWRLNSISFSPIVTENTSLFGGLCDTNGEPNNILLHQDCKYYYQKMPLETSACFLSRKQSRLCYTSINEPYLQPSCCRSPAVYQFILLSFACV